MIVHYMLHLLLNVVFLYVKLIVTPHPVYSTSPSTQGIESDPTGEAGFRYLHQAHFLEGLLCSATSSSKKLQPRGLHVNLDITIFHVRGKRELSIFLNSTTKQGAKN
jgi:hypothetical protein